MEEQEEHEDKGFSEEKGSLSKVVDISNLDVDSLQHLGMQGSPAVSQDGADIYNSYGYGSNNNDNDE